MAVNAARCRYPASVNRFAERLLRDGSGVICEVCDKGRIVDPLAGRRRPSINAAGGRGLWIANQLCDLVQLRTFAGGGVVRLHMRIADASAAS
jgi:hypothetical protein